MRTGAFLGVALFLFLSILITGFLLAPMPVRVIP